VTRFFADHAWLGGDHAVAEVLVDVDETTGRITAVTPGAERPGDAVHLRGLTLPGFANTHSHAFHRALRGRTHAGGGTFWTWREEMYAVAARLTPDSYYALARATFAEMALAGFTCVGEFHYVHHDTGGVPYADANAFGDALIRAAGEAGIRITLLDTCYLTGGFDLPLQGPQLRFSDGDADGWAARAGALRAAGHARIGAAIHSVRAVPAEQLATVAAWAHDRGAPLHMHVSEQRAENDACVAAHGRTPTELLDDHGALGPHACAVHATHLTDADVARLGRTSTSVCFCCTTERDLADGIGAARDLAQAGTPLVLGTDSNAMIDAFEETRAIELDERLRSELRGAFTSAELLRAATADGHAALGWPEAHGIVEGAIGDLVTVGLGSVRMAGVQPGTLLDTALFAASASDVREVVVGGRHVVADGRHLLVGDVAGALRDAIAEVLP